MDMWSQAAEDQGLAHSGVLEAHAYITQDPRETAAGVFIAHSASHIERNSSSGGKGFPICARDNWNWK